jgi:hypothetical protein
MVSMDINYKHGGRAHTYWMISTLKDVQDDSAIFTQVHWSRLKASGAKERVHLDDVKVFIPRDHKYPINCNQVALECWSSGGEGESMLSCDLETW